MILDAINWSGVVEVNGTKYDNIADARRAFSNTSAPIESIRLYTNEPDSSERKLVRLESTSDSEKQYVITVKAYMTKPATATFDFMAKWNNNTPMPLVTMVGTVEKETRGMVYMKLHGDITAKITQRCMKCGKPITNPVSQFFGMGPECGGHHYVNPFNSDEELKEAVAHYRRDVLQQMKWEGWIIKSAIISQEEYYEDNTDNP